MDNFNDLVYANINPVVPMRPVKELTDLYKAKQEDYIYAKDASNKFGNAILSTPHTADDEPAIRQIYQESADVLSKWEQEGDYENKVLDVNKLTSDLTKKLLPLQQKKAQENAWLESALSRDKDGNYIHDPNDVKKARVLNSKINKPSVYDPELGTYIGSFTGVDIPINKNYSEEVDKVLKDWKANKITLTDSNGNPLTRLPNTGYLVAGDKEYTDDAELIRAAKSYLMSDPDFKHKLQFDLSYDLATLTDRNGNPRGVNIEDISSLPNDAIQKVAKEYGLVSGKPLENQLVENNIPLDEFYSNAKIESEINKTIELGVDKQSFEAYKNTYLKDDLTLDWFKDQRTAKDNIDTGYTSITKVYSTNLLHPADYNNIKEGLSASKDNLQQAKISLNKAIQNKNASPEDLAILKDNVDNAANDAENFERQLKSLRTHIESESNFDFESTYEEYVNKIKLQRRNKLVFNEGRTTREEVEKEYPILPLEDYKNSVIDSFINKDYENLAESVITRHDEGRIDYAAEQLAKSYGGDVETKPFNIDYHTYNVEGEGKDATLYKGFIKNKKEALRISPETFVNGNDNVFTLLEKEDIDPNDVSFEKSDLYFLVENVNRKPGYVIGLVDKEGNPIIGKNGEQKKLTVNHEGDLLNDRDIVNNIVANEAYNRFQNKDINNLDITDKALLSKLSLAYFDNSPSSKYFDDLNLYAASSGEELPFYLNGKRDANQKPDMIIVARDNIINPNETPEDENKSYVSDLLFNVKLPDGRFLSQDDSGNPTWTYKTENTPITFNSPSEIKEELGRTLLIDQMNRKDDAINGYYPNEQSNDTSYGTYDLRTILGNNITNNTIPYVTPSTYSSVVLLKNDFPNLYVTDASRSPNTNIGSPTSMHKEGNALDVRINADSIRLMKMDKDVLENKYGIVLMEGHNGNKGKTTNLQEADHFHIVFK